MFTEKNQLEILLRITYKNSKEEDTTRNSYIWHKSKILSIANSWYLSTSFNGSSFLEDRIIGFQQAQKPSSLMPSSFFF